MMLDLNKPDLLIHSWYAKSMSNYNLDTFFNILTLTKCAQHICLVTDKGSKKLVKAKQTPFFTASEIKRSGLKPQYTTFNITKETRIRGVQQRGPRYVVWPKNEILTESATFVDRVDEYELYEASERAKTWAIANQIHYHQSLIVFDLDETLIDSDGRPYQHVDKVLHAAKQAYDKVVLYSHGSHLHVYEHLAELKRGADNFDLILSNNGVDKKTAKNMLNLYTYFPNIRFTKATLVDDSMYNITKEYTNILIPKVKKTLYHLLPLIFSN